MGRLQNMIRSSGHEQSALTHRPEAVHDPQPGTWLHEHTSAVVTIRKVTGVGDIAAASHAPLWIRRSGPHAGGAMNAISLLIQQHRQMEEMFEAALKAEGRRRAKLFGDVADALMSHVSVEEAHFFPTVRAKRTEDVLLESLEEHLSLKRLVADLLDLDASDPRYESKLHVLKEQSEHHHEEEEEKLFPQTRKLFDDDELDELGEVMEEAQTKLLAGHPRELAREETLASAELR